MAEPTIERTPEQEAELKAKRRTFKELHDVFKDDKWPDAQQAVMDLVGLIYEAKEREAKSRQFKDLDVKPAEGSTEKMEVALKVLGELTIHEAEAFLGALENAITVHNRIKTKDLTVADLEVKLFE